MKKALLTILLLIIAALFALNSCVLIGGNAGGSDNENKEETSGEENNGEGEKEETPEPDNLIYSDSSELYLFFAEHLKENTATSIMSGLDSSRKKVVNLGPLSSENKKHEIVIGDTARDVSKQALIMLNRIEKYSEDEYSFLIYSSGSSVALVWDEDDEGIMEKLAVEYFIKNYVKSELILKTGVAHSETVDLLEDYYKVLDTEYKEEKWAEFEAAVGKELTEAYKQLYSLYESKSVVWLANLYDPDICVCVDYYGEEKCSGSRYCGGAGFYYSNSGRDNMGFLPDIESTTQAFSFLASAGLAYRYNNHYPNIVPDDMKAAVCKFFNSLQEPNGYFYHPQWGIEFTDSKISRRARDLNSATTILRVFGSQPVYDTPNGVKGSGIIPTSNLTTKLGKSAAIMASKVVLTADVPAPHLKDLESFKAYLNGLDIENDSYFVGNELTSQNNQVIARDKVIGTPDNPTPLMDATIEWLNYHQKENGAWDDKKPGDVGYLSPYYASNGLLKISGIYNAAGRVFPNAKAACETAITATLCDTDVGTVVELYNTWYCIQVIIDTLRLYGDESDEALADEIVAGLRESAVEAIKISREKDSVFFKADGSASYGVHQTAAESQGCPVAITGTNEGDVNATIIALTGIVKHSLAALELENYEVPIFGEYERVLFYKTINNLSPIVKKDEGEIPSPVDFESDDIGEESAFVETIHYGPDGKTEVLADPTGSGKGNVLKLTSVAGKGDYVKMRNETVSGIAKVSVFEGDFYVINSSASYSVQILMENQYMLTFRTEGNDVRIVEVSSGTGAVALEEDLLIPAKMNEWFRLKVEYYYDVHGKVRIKIYADTDLSDGEEMKLYAVTDNYYDGNGVKFPDKEGKPYKEYHGFNIYAMSGVNIEMYIDNLNCYKINKAYEPETDPDNQPPINVDSPDRESIVYDFENGLPEGFVVSDDGFASVENGSIGFAKTEDGNGTVSIPVNVRTSTANCAVADFDIYSPTATEGESYLRIRGMEGREKIFGFVLKAPMGSGGEYLTLVPENEDLQAEIEEIKIPVGEKIRVSLAYYHGEDGVLIYVNGEFVGATDALYKDGFKRKMKELVISEMGSDPSGITLDNVKVDKVVSSFESAVTQGSADKIYDFETEDSAVSLSGGANRVMKGDYEIRLDSSATAASVFIPVNNRSRIFTAVIAEIDIAVTEGASDGCVAYITVEDGEGGALMSFALYLNRGKVELKQVGVDGVLPYTIADFPKGEKVTLRFEAFVRDGAIVVYKEGEAICMSPVFATDTPHLSTVCGLRIESGEKKSVVSVDDVRIETAYKLLGTPDVKSNSNPETDLSLGLDFESSTLDSMPVSIDKELKSVGSYLKIRRVYNAYRKAYSNVLAFDTAPGENDTLNFDSTENFATYKGVAFETDIKLDYTNGNPTHRITFSDKSGKNAAYMMLIYVRGGKIVFEDTSNLDTDIGIETTSNTGVDSGDWFNLRVEYYFGDSENMRIRILINGKVVAVSDNFAGRENAAAIPSSLIEKVSFYSMNATDCTLSFDNVKLEGLTVGCVDDVTASPVD